MRLRAEMGGKKDEEVTFRAGKKPLVQQVPPPPVERPAVKSPDGRLPRITKLLERAVRFEELLRQGTAKDYADLARLGSVTRARITQLMNLRNLAPRIQEQCPMITPSRTSSRNEPCAASLERSIGENKYECSRSFAPCYAAKLAAATR